MKERIYLAGILAAALVLFLAISGNHGEDMTGLFLDRPVKAVIGPTSSGYFYPDDASELRQVISDYLSRAGENITDRPKAGAGSQAPDAGSQDSGKQGMPKPRAIIVPHSSYEYSGLTAARGYSTLEGHKYRKVMVLAPSTQYIFDGAAIPKAVIYKTPLGMVNISASVHGMEDGALVFSTDRVFDIEHSIDVQVPFLQHVLGGFELLPVLTGRADPEELADRISPYIDDDTLLVVSSDLSHYHSYDEALLMDRNCTKGITGLDFPMMGFCEATGKPPILALMLLARERGWTARLLHYSNSGDTFGMRESVVGYASFVFSPQRSFSQPL